MDKNSLLIQLRTKKIGLLIYDARLAARRSVEESAQAIGIPIEDYQAYERGEKSPSLPELENLALFLDTPLEHFWGGESLSTRRKVENIQQKEQLRKIRNRVIGASLRMARERSNSSLAETAQTISIPEETLAKYESGELPVPIPVLETLSKHLEGRLDDFVDQKGPVGKWRQEKVEVEQFLQLPPEVRTFLSKPVNLPYLTLAMRLNDLSVEKLRSIAETLLEITF
jgi:transcriptional regulator with XRE-family HTH domain